jgi:trans-aconitate 2-methyltransferase
VTEWNATAYHKVSGPQTGWGQEVLARIELRGDERAIDAGCGSHNTGPERLLVLAVLAPGPR